MWLLLCCYLLVAVSSVFPFSFSLPILFTLFALFLFYVRSQCMRWIPKSHSNRKQKGWVIVGCKVLLQVYSMPEVWKNFIANNEEKTKVRARDDSHYNINIFRKFLPTLTIIINPAYQFKRHCNSILSGRQAFAEIHESQLSCAVSFIIIFGDFEDSMSSFVAISNIWKLTKFLLCFFFDGHLFHLNSIRDRRG